MLSLVNAQAAYGPSRVLFDVNVEVPDGKIVTLLGRNGMGKTTTVRAIMGLVANRRGIVFEGASIDTATPEAIARVGVGLVPEGRMVFPTLTVRENLIATAAQRDGRNHWTLQRIYELFPRLAERANQYANTLSGGEQQMLAVGRALMTNPKLLILDEATEGLAPVVRGEIWRCIEALKECGQSILLIDKNVNVLKRLADHHFILEKGRTVWSGDSAALQRETATLQRYLGI